MRFIIRKINIRFVKKIIFFNYQMTYFFPIIHFNIFISDEELPALILK